MKARILVSTIGLAGAAILVGQMTAHSDGPPPPGLDQGGRYFPQGERVFDIDPCQIYALTQFGRLGTYPSGTVALSVSTVGHNNGTAEIPWHAAPEVDHPVIGMNLHRINAEGRLEQVGMSWLKHGFLALQQNLCGSCQSCNCSGRRLGIQCADTYGASLNANQYYLGPRWEIRPNENRWMDGLSYSGSHFTEDGNNTGGDNRSHNAAQHRLRVQMGDLTEAEAEYFYEVIYIMLRDYTDQQYNDLVEIPDHVFNNVSHRKTRPAHDGSGNFTFSDLSSTIAGPALAAWGDVQSVAMPNADGVVYVSSRAVDLGNGQFRYEYCVMNHTLDGEVAEFSVPVGNAQITNVGFHQPFDGYWDSNGNFVNESPYDVGEWSSIVENNSLTFTPPAPAGNMRPNTIRWGTMYTFWFTADAGPASGGNVQATVRSADGNVPLMTADVTGPGTPTHFATLTDVEIEFGTHVRGDLNDLATSDDSRYVVNSIFGFSVEEATLLQIRVGGTTDVQNGSGIRASVEASINHPSGLARVKMHNFATGQDVEIGQYQINQTETVQSFTYIGNDVADFVNDADGRMELVARTAVLASFSLQGFRERFDHVMFGVQE